MSQNDIIEEDNVSTSSETTYVNWIETLHDDDIMYINEHISEEMEFYWNDNFTYYDRITDDNFMSEYQQHIIDEIFEWLLEMELCESIHYEDVCEYVAEIQEQLVIGGLIQPGLGLIKDISILYPSPVEKISKQLDWLKSLPQPAQQSPEWYELRRTVITASNWEFALTRPARFIYDRVMEILRMANNTTDPDTKTIRMGPPPNINPNDPRQWGIKYEPVTQAIYKHTYNTDIAEFGCIVHPKYPFLGASPDGINCDPTNPYRYGHMLEIKNIFNRVITGIPKSGYWIQMQGQMEVCDLEYCDFTETRIREYGSREQALADETPERIKGVVLYFTERNSNSNWPKYVYMPLSISITDDVQMNAWITQTRMQMASKYELHKTLFYYEDERSCITVQRNEKWFEWALPRLKAVHDDIQKFVVDTDAFILFARENGFEKKNFEWNYKWE